MAKDQIKRQELYKEIGDKLLEISAIADHAKADDQWFQDVVEEVVSSMDVMD